MSFLLPSLYSVLSCIDCPTSFVFSPSVILLLLLSSHNLILMFHEAHLMSQPRAHTEKPATVMPFHSIMLYSSPADVKQRQNDGTVPSPWSNTAY